MNVAQGSPPRAGTRLADHPRLSRPHGITPARRDETFRAPCRPWHRSDHPRARGRNRSTHHTSSKRPGSPPRAGTKRDSTSKSRVGVRITPARGDGTMRSWYSRTRPPDHPPRADETGPSRASATASWDHPRARDEMLTLPHDTTHTWYQPRARGRDAEQETEYVNHVGSPPRAGTKHSDLPQGGRLPGITLAREDETPPR